MTLLQIHPNPPHLQLDLAYATKDNFSGECIYKSPLGFLHKNAFEAFERVQLRVKALGLGIKIFDAFRPHEAQIKLWDICPGSPYVADPQIGSHHSRGVALDLTLVDLDHPTKELDMGTPFDDFTPRAHHGFSDLSTEVQKNRLILLGVMSECGWTHLPHEWWHYQLAGPDTYPLLSNADAPLSMM